MPRGSKTTKKAVAPKRPPRKAKAHQAEETEKLPDLETFLIDLYDWPDVTDLLAAEAYGSAAEKFSDVSNFRTQLKEDLTPCYGKRRIPRTPKKLAHKVPRLPLQAARVINFDLSEDSHANISGNSAVIAVTNVVPQTPSTKLRMPASALNETVNTTGVTQTQSPYNLLCPTNPVITATPSANTLTRVPSIRAMQSSASHTTPKQTAPDNDRLHEINKKLEIAGIRHDNYVREQQERVARDNEQRKRRVNQNLQQKQLEEQRKQEEHRLHQERIRQFEKAQRSPKTTPRKVVPATFSKAVQVQTPGQQAVPQKRQKRESGDNNTHSVVKPVHKSNLPVPKPRPAIITKASSHQRTEESGDDIIEEEEVVQQAIKVIHLEESVVIEDEVIYREEVSEGVFEASKGDNEVPDKENQQLPVPQTPAVTKQDVSAYEMTPDKVFQPSTEHDYNVNDLSSGDETDNEDNPRKKVPSWAEKSTLRAHVKNLFRHVSKDAVNAYFGVVSAPTVATLFADGPKNYDSMINETTAWDSPITNPRSAPILKTNNRI